MKRTATLLASGGFSLVRGLWSLRSGSAVVELSRKLLATCLDGAELMLETGSSAGAVKLRHEGVVLSTEDNSGSVHGCDHASDLVEREGLGLGLFLRSHVD